MRIQLSSNSMEQLIKGFNKFHANFFLPNIEMFTKLTVEGQKPHTCVLTCCDARLDTSIVFQTEPGELFVIRNVAAVIPPYTSHHDVSVQSAIEFAVLGLEVKNIIILGHSLCGGISFICNHRDNPETFPNVHEWMENHHFEHELNHKSCELRSILQSVNNLKKYRFLENNSEVDIQGLYFHMQTGHLYALQEKEGNFKLIAPDDQQGEYRISL